MFGWWRRWLDRKIDARIAERASAIEGEMKAEAISAQAALREKWLFFNRSLKFKDDAPLSQVIYFFSVPAEEYMARHHPRLHATHPHVTPLAILAAICEAEPHRKHEIMIASAAVWPDAVQGMLDRGDQLRR